MAKLSILPPLIPTFSNDIKDLIAKGKTEKSIETLKDWFKDIVKHENNILLISSRFYKNKSDELYGRVTKEYASVEMTKINEAILNFLSDTNDREIFLIIGKKIENLIQEYQSVRQKNERQEDYVNIFQGLCKYHKEVFFPHIANHILGILCKEGLGTEKKLDEALFFLQIKYNEKTELRIISSIDRNKDRDLLIGEIYVEKCCFSLALEYFLKSASRNNNWAWINIADLYEHGKGVKTDVPTAVNFYKKVHQGNEVALKEMAEAKLMQLDIYDNWFEKMELNMGNIFSKSTKQE